MQCIRTCRNRSGILSAVLPALVLLFSMPAHSFGVMTAGSSTQGLPSLSGPVNIPDRSTSPLQLLSQFTTVRKFQPSLSMPEDFEEEEFPKQKDHRLEEFLKKYIIIINEYGQREIVDSITPYAEHSGSTAAIAAYQPTTDVDTSTIHVSNMPEGILFLPTGKEGETSGASATSTTQNEADNPPVDPTPKKTASSVKSVGHFWFRQLAKYVI